MTDSLPQNVAGLKGFFGWLDRFLLEKAMQWARGWFKAITEEIDRLLMRQKDSALSVKHKREVWYQTCLGQVKIKRRQYKEGSKYRYLLDEVMGVSKYRHVTEFVQQRVLEMAAVMPYRRSADVLRKLSAIDIPHQTIWRMVGRAADPHLKQAEQELKSFLETGEIPEGKTREAVRLMVEADGVMLSLQREREKKTEVKLGIAYEGWDKVGKNRYRTVNKTAFSAVSGGESFWGGMTLKLLKTYDLARVKETVVGGDGARWVKEGAKYMNGRFQLDQYHVNRSLCMALGNDRKTKTRVWEAINRGEIGNSLKILAEALNKAQGKQADAIASVYRYLGENSTGLQDYRMDMGEEGKALRRTGVIEGNVDKLIARRMKNQGMSWSIQGIRRLLWVRFMVLEGSLANHLKIETIDQIPPVPRRKVRNFVNCTLLRDPSQWLQASLPALYGPHSSRPWVKILKTVSGV